MNLDLLHQGKGQYPLLLQDIPFAIAHNIRRKVWIGSASSVMPVLLELQFEILALFEAEGIKSVPQAWTCPAASHVVAHKGGQVEMHTTTAKRMAGMKGRRIGEQPTMTRTGRSRPSARIVYPLLQETREIRADFHKCSAGIMRQADDCDLGGRPSWRTFQLSQRIKATLALFHMELKST